MSDERALGDFLRARRALVEPDAPGTRRRVPGLRREEVALLAGISADYYLRLEQGRDRHPSPQVLEAVARALHLDEPLRAHLHELAAQPGRRPRRRAPREVVPPGILALLDGLPFPAFVEGRAFDVLAANPFATALSPRMSVGRNRLRDVFLEPAEQALVGVGDDAALRGLVAGFRRSIGTATSDARVVELVGELSLASPRFAELWARHDVAEREEARVLLQHPEVGPLRLLREKLGVGGTDGQTLVIYHPEPGTDAAERLVLLAGLATTAAGSGA